MLNATPGCRTSGSSTGFGSSTGGVDVASVDDAVSTKSSTVVVAVCGAGAGVVSSLVDGSEVETSSVDVASPSTLPSVIGGVDVGCSVDDPLASSAVPVSSDT